MKAAVKKFIIINNHIRIITVRFVQGLFHFCKELESEIDD